MIWILVADWLKILTKRLSSNTLTKEIVAFIQMFVVSALDQVTEKRLISLKRHRQTQ